VIGMPDHEIPDYSEGSRVNQSVCFLLSWNADCAFAIYSFDFRPVARIEVIADEDSIQLEGFLN
jgi:hypothetical protein